MSFMSEGAPKLILASKSKSRQHLFDQVGLRYETHPASVDEKTIRESMHSIRASVTETAQELSFLKAKQISETNPDALVIGGDQIIACQDRWYEKPEDMAAAAEQLRSLSGQTMTLVSAGVAVRQGMRVWSHVGTAEVRFRNFDENFIKAYCEAAGEVILESVGACQVEALGLHLIAETKGDHATILGMPMMPLLQFLRDHQVIIG